MLRSEGHLDGGMGGIMAQLTSSEDYFEELNNLIHDADWVIVGNDVRDDGAEEIAQLFDGVTEVTETKIKQARVTVEESGSVSDSVVEWLEEHKGEEVFQIHW